MFGYTIDTPQVRYFGARAIYHSQRIDLLSDRMTCSMEDSTAQNAFIFWINHRALPWLRAEIERIGLAHDDPKVLVLSEFKYELRASTNKSYGYLYIGAIEHTMVEGPPRFNTASDKMERVVIIRDEKIVVSEGLVPVGTEGSVSVNGIGPAKVVGYFNEKYCDDYKLACLLLELQNPPKWWIDQTIAHDIRSAIKSGEIALKKGSKTEPSSASLKEFKKNWRVKPAVFFPNDFATKAA